MADVFSIKTVVKCQLFQKNPPQTSEVLKSEKKTFTPLLQNFSSLAPDGLIHVFDNFSRKFQKKSEKLFRVFQKFPKSSMQLHIYDGSTCKAYSCKFSAL
jgi:hypothetical protein